MEGTQFQGYAVVDAKNWSDLALIPFQPKTFGPHDVELAITHCGVCASDVHTACSGWAPLKPPLVVGHEIVGTVRRVGDAVTDIAVGQRAGVGAMVGSCGTCAECKRGEENYCRVNPIFTYNSVYPDGVRTHGGYATAIRADERFVFPIPDGLASSDAASMLCGGLTVFQPLSRYGIGPGSRVGVIGIGGLGHYAVMFAKALGADVVAFTSNLGSKADDVRAMGADHVVSTTEKGWDKPHHLTLDLLISTRSAADNFPLTAFLRTLRPHGTLVLVGAPEKPLPAFNAFPFIQTGVALAGSHIGSKREARAMLALAVRRADVVRPWIEERPMREAGRAMVAVHEGRVRYRVVLVQDIHEDGEKAKL